MALHNNSFSLRSRRAQSPRSGRQHKAWGASPRIRSQTTAPTRETGDSVKFRVFRPLSRALATFIGTLTWGLHPRLYAYACYRRLRNNHSISTFCAMNIPRFLTLPLFAVALLLSASPLYSVPVTAAQKERSAHSKKPTQFHYVCPMHEDVASKKPGTCRKCKMKLVKQPVPQEPAQ